MAVASYIVCESLCYIKSKFEKSTIKQLKTVLSNFYSAEELAKAKDLLYDAGNKIAGVAKAADTGDNGAIDWEFPKLIKRTGEGKCKRAAEDLLDAFVWLDERKLIDSLPLIFAENLNRIPLVKLEDLDVYAMVQKMDEVESRLLKLENTSKNKPVVNSRQQSSPLSNHSGNASASTGNVSHVMEEKDVVDANSGVASQSTHLDEASTWAMVTRRKGKKTSKNTSTGSKSVRICGESSSSSSTLMAGVDIQRKAVFHVDNLIKGSTVDVMKDFLQKNSIKVLTCFHAKSWMREHEQVEAFRVCVPAVEGVKVLNKAIWPMGVLVREWKFKEVKNS